MKWFIQERRSFVLVSKKFCFQKPFNVLGISIELIINFIDCTNSHSTQKMAVIQSIHSIQTNKIHFSVLLCAPAYGINSWFAVDRISYFVNVCSGFIMILLSIWSFNTKFSINWMNIAGFSRALFLQIFHVS